MKVVEISDYFWKQNHSFLKVIKYKQLGRSEEDFSGKKPKREKFSFLWYNYSEDKYLESYRSMYWINNKKFSIAIAASNCQLQISVTPKNNQILHFLLKNNISKWIIWDIESDMNAKILICILFLHRLVHIFVDQLKMSNIKVIMYSLRKQINYMKTKRISKEVKHFPNEKKNLFWNT